MRRRLIALALVPALGLAACSADDDATQSGTTATTLLPATVSQPPTTVPTTPPTTVAPTTVVVTVTARAVAPSTTQPAVTYDLTLPATCSMGAPAEFGSSGDDVRCLQERLQQVSSGGTPVTPDGQFGAATERAVRDFQELNDLLADGIAGPRTAELLGIWSPVATTPSAT